MQRVVLDTNVLIDGARDEHSAAWRIIERVLAGGLTAIVSHRLVAEYHALLPQRVQDASYRSRIETVLDAAEHVRAQRVAEGVLDDPDDTKVLATALAGRADAIISSDRHLLNLDPYQGVRILTPQAFENLRQEEGDGWSTFVQSLGIGPRD